MGKRGPIPTPTAVLNMRDSWRGKARKNEPKPPDEPMECPRWLTDKAQRMFKKIAPQLELMGVGTLLDSNALARYCQLHSRWRDAEEWIRKHGDQYPVKAFNAVTDQMEVVGFRMFPKVRIASALADQLNRLEREFGMTPSARARLSIAQDDTEKDEKLEEKRRFLGVG